MAFSRNIDHLNGDERPFHEFVLPRPHTSVLFHVRDDQLAAHAILKGDVVVIERDRPLRGSSIALASVAGSPRLVLVRYEGGRFTFDNVPGDEPSVELLGIATCVVRPLLA